MGKLFKVALPLLVIGTGLAGVGWLKATKPEPRAKAAEERVWVVDTVPVEFRDIRPTLDLFGEIVAGREVELRALVAGPVISVSDGFADGRKVAAGTVLVTVDPFDAAQTVAERKADVDEGGAILAETRGRLEAERALLEEDRRQVEIYRRDVARRESLVGNAVSEKGLDDARLALSRSRVQLIVRQQTIDALSAGLRQQEAMLERRRAVLSRAERALADTELKVPFDGYLVDTAAQVGKRLAMGDRVARLIDSRRLEVRFHLSDAEFGRAFTDLRSAEGRPVRVVWRTGGRAQEFDAVFDRIDGEIDAASGGVTAYAQLVDDGGEGFASLRPGAFVEVSIADRLYRRVGRVPETALHGGHTVYAVVDGRLDPRAVAVVGRDGEHALITGAIAETDIIVVTRLAEIAPGLKVAVR